LFVLLLSASPLYAECDFEPEALNRYEDEILRAAERDQPVKMAEPLACILRMQSESEDMSRVLSASYLRPLLGGAQIKGVKIDPRYKKVAGVLEKLALHSKESTQLSFVSEFSKGDWRFYTLFCEKGNVEYCSVFLPDETRVKSESPLIAAASMM